MAAHILGEVKAYKTSDGSIHQSKLAALMAEKAIQLRGLVQSGFGGVPLKNGTLTIGDAVSILMEKAEDIVKVTRSLDAAIKRERTKANIAVNQIAVN